VLGHPRRSGAHASCVLASPLRAVGSDKPEAARIFGGWRIVSVIVVGLFPITSAIAGAIREFSTPTLERPGDELYRSETIAN
jgi:hypothetical protein